MAQHSFLSQAQMDPLIQALRAAGHRVVAPSGRDGRTEVQEVTGWPEVRLEGPPTTLSPKSLVFPRVERMLAYETPVTGQVQLHDVQPEVTPTVLLGARSCDARGFQRLGEVFNWDTRDRFHNLRREALTVVGVACTEADSACFCEAVGGGPGDPTGSDLFLTPTAGGFRVEVLTERGQALCQLAPGCFTPLSEREVPVALASTEGGFTAEGLYQLLPERFEHPVWDEQALRCLGCGACAYVCPTCACFDLQEEADPRQGQRLRTWDSCGVSQFTLHASGHNPRHVQGQRWRQRVFHKFRYFHERFGTGSMCVGCGRCSRACPRDMDLREHLAEVAQLAD